MFNLPQIVNALKLRNEIVLNGGISYNINTGESNPEFGYMVSLEGHEEAVRFLDEQTIKDYIAKHSEALAQDDCYFGAWYVGDDVHVLDVSKHFEHKRDAYFNAILWHQKAIWDCELKDEIWIHERKTVHC